MSEFFFRKEYFRVAERKLEDRLQPRNRERKADLCNRKAIDDIFNCLAITYLFFDKSFP